MNVIEDRDDETMIRLRAALRQIATDDLRATSVVPLASGMASRRRSWVRPATIAAGVVLIAGAVGIANLALAGDGDGGAANAPTVVSEDGATTTEAPAFPTERVRVIPGPLPADVGFDVLHDMVGTVTLHVPQDSEPSVRVWHRLEAGYYESSIVLRVQVSEDEASLLREAATDTVTVNGREIRIIDDGPHNFRAVTETPDCGFIDASGTARSDIDAATQVVGSLTCDEVNGVVEMNVSDPPGFVPGKRDGEGDGGVVSIEATTGRTVSFVVSQLDPPTPQPTTFPDGGGEVRTIGGHDVTVWPLDGGSRTYLWAPVPGVNVSVSGIDLTETEVEAIIAGSRIVSEEEWQAWREANRI